MSPEDLSRRGWILRLGGAALLRDVTLNGLSAAQGPQLPPGLYEPSLQHLAHSLKTAIAPLPEQPSPQYFGAEDFSVIRMLIARVLGEELTDPVILEVAAWIDLIAGRAADTRAAAHALSAAHRRLAVDYYGEDTVRELESEDPQAICRDGLAALKQGGFQNLDPNAQVAHLVDLENGNDPFISWIKRRTLDGFYTSRRGLQELDYKGNAFYAESPGCDHENRSQ
jgi:hypothetical protein